MISTSERQRVFIDADVLAHPISRSLILFGSIYPDTGFVACWSLAAEAEADAALARQWERTLAKSGVTGRSMPVGVAELRQHPGSQDWASSALIGPATEEDMVSLDDTSETDKHIVAAAHGAGCRIVVSQNVRDFGRTDLKRFGLSVVCPDVFLSLFLDSAAYQFALELMAAHRSRDPRTPEAIHQALGRSHPRLVSLMASEFPEVTPLEPENQPSEVFRGDRCLVCGKTLRGPDSLACGVGPECRKTN
ncbi:MAG: DUF6011 domain-containing protein [Propionibacteriaceae bacterium]|jgi:hypothetical protein|nr:DUF6011 domain-containing protein [Propionibacteriaceae bacterium]